MVGEKNIFLNNFITSHEAIIQSRVRFEYIFFLQQVTKQSLSARVVDEQQIERHFSMNELAELYEYNDEPIVSWCIL